MIRTISLSTLILENMKRRLKFNRLECRDHHKAHSLSALADAPCIATLGKIVELNYNQIQVRIAELERNAKVLQYVTLKNALRNKAQEMRKLALPCVQQNKTGVVALNDLPSSILMLHQVSNTRVDGVIEVPRGRRAKRAFTITYRKPSTASCAFRIGERVTAR